jgi:hypothetical protein
MISRRRGNRTPDHRARYRPNPWTESGIARRNQNQSTPALTMTHTADSNHTTNPQSTNNPSTLQSSTITKPTTQNTRTTDQTGKHRTKSEPVHTHAGPCPAANHGIIAEARNHRDLITPSQSTAGVPGTQNTRTTDQTGEHRPKTDPVRACADHGITPATRPTPQTRGIPMISQRRGNRTPDRRARYRPNPWTESGIARRNRNQSIPAPTMTHHADRNHTTKPQNTNNPNTLPSSTIAKRTTQNTRTTDQTGKRKPKTDPVRACADHGITPATRPTPQTRRISTISRQHEHRTTTTDDGWYCPVDAKQAHAGNRGVNQLGEAPDSVSSASHSPRSAARTVCSS